MSFETEAQIEIRELHAALGLCGRLFGPSDRRTLFAVHALAMAQFGSGDVEGAERLLHDTLDRLTPSLGKEHPSCVDLLHTLGHIALAEGGTETAARIFREVLECDIRYSGPNHPSSIEARGDLAGVLFELGQDEEAESLEIEACEGASQHLGCNHPITTTLGWNRVISLERRGRIDAANLVIAEYLSWLLTEEPSRLEPGQNTIRSLVAERLHWSTAPLC